jgi:hypothetical protein
MKRGFQMRNLKAGVAIALVGGMLVAPVAAAGQGGGFLAGTAKAEAKQPYTNFSVRARSAADGTIAATAILDAQGQFKLDGLTAGKFVVELTKTGQNKVICSEGPFDIAADAGKAGIDIKCNQPAAAYLLLAAAAAAGVTAGIVAGGDPASGAQ